MSIHFLYHHRPTVPFTERTFSHEIPSYSLHPALPCSGCRISDRLRLQRGQLHLASESCSRQPDPQIAQESPERIAVTNLYRGLTRIDENGDAVLDCAESYTVSEDGLTYTFTLKEDLAYTKLKKHEKEYPLTAADFVFGMERVFREETNSPYRELFSNLKGAEGGTLGVSAPDERTVVYQLNAPDPAFLEKLAQPGAMPCNEEFLSTVPAPTV